MKHRVLVIGDLHLPFCRKGYLEHCIKTYKEENCDTVVFIGDILDEHYLSYHEKDVDGDGQNLEMKKALRELKKWFEAFPVAKVTLGNHDRLARRKGFTMGISTRWFKDFKEVIGAPEGWDIGMVFVIDGVRYSHGDGEGTAIKTAEEHGISSVHGHLHVQAYIQYHSFYDKLVFGLQAGCGVDSKGYGSNYVKANKKSRMILSCAVIYNSTNARIFPMKLRRRRG